MKIIGADINIEHHTVIMEIPGLAKKQPIVES
jgi:hypothetical protein